MKYRRLGNTGFHVSEIGLGAEWLERHTAKECKEIIDCCEQVGINIMDLWMSEPNVRTNIGDAIKGRRDQWIIQGHIGPIWENGQYAGSRDAGKVQKSFEDLLQRLGTDYLDIGVIHHVDSEKEMLRIHDSLYYRYILELKEQGRIRAIGLSTHNPAAARKAVELGMVETILFSINPAFDLLPATEDMDDYWRDTTYDNDLGGINPERADLYRFCDDYPYWSLKGLAEAVADSKEIA